MQNPKQTFQFQAAMAIWLSWKVESMARETMSTRPSTTQPRESDLGPRLATVARAKAFTPIRSPSSAMIGISRKIFLKWEATRKFFDYGSVLWEKIKFVFFFSFLGFGVGEILVNEWNFLWINVKVDLYRIERMNPIFWIVCWLYWFGNGVNRRKKKYIYIYIVLLILFKWIRGHTLFIDKVTHVQKMCKMNSYNCSKKTQLFEGIINVFINKEFGQTGPNPHGSV